MRAKKWKENLSGITPLDYIHFKNVPMKQTEHGPVIDLAPHILDELAAKAILQERIPLRGLEVNFLRKIIGLSMEKFANGLGLSAATVFHWEKAKEERLSIVNELAVRTFVAEKLEIELSGKFSELVGDRLKNLTLSA